MSDAKVQEKLVARLRAFAKLDGNRLCADCSEKVRSILCVSCNCLSHRWGLLSGRER